LPFLICHLHKEERARCKVVKLVDPGRLALRSLLLK